MADNLLVTGEVLQQKWTKFADLVGVVKDEHLNLSEGWLAHFKTRNGLKQFKHHGEAASADLETVEYRVVIIVKHKCYPCLLLIITISIIFLLPGMRA